MSGGILTDPTSDNIEFLKKKKKKKKKKKVFFSPQKKKSFFFFPPSSNCPTCRHYHKTGRHNSDFFPQETVHPHFRQNRLAVMKKERRVLH